jgi:hypothetical protein
VWTQGQCDARLADELARYAADVGAALGLLANLAQRFGGRELGRGGRCVLGQPGVQGLLGPFDGRPDGP